MRQVELLYQKVVLLLIDSELTSNFPTPRIWKILDSKGQLKNMWSQGAKVEDKPYNKERNSGEVKLFGSLSGNVSAEPTGGGRPYYIALSPGCLQQGAAPYYGRSYMVYSDAVKLRCTFTATDSLQMLKGMSDVSRTDVCSMATIANVLLRVTDRELKYLCSLATGLKAESPNEFIEAQGWGELNLSADVKMLVISEYDLESMVMSSADHPDLMPEELLKLGPSERKTAIENLKKRLGEFCRKHAITLKFLRLGPDTMNSDEKRPA